MSESSYRAAKKQGRFLYIVGQLRDGGLERQLYYLLRTMDRERYGPQVVVWNYCEDDKYVTSIRELGVPLHAFSGACSMSRIRKMKELRRLVHRLEPEVIHSYSFYTNSGAWYGALGTDTLSIGSVRSDFGRAKRESGFFVGGFSARWPQTQIFNNFAAAESARSAVSPFAPRHCFVVRNGIDLERFRSTPLPNGYPVKIVGIGSLAPVKRWDRLLKAAYHLKQQGLKFIVRVVGDGPLRASLDRQAQELSLKDSVEFVSRTDEIPAVLSEATILVHTSESEGCPNVVMEAMACGRPVVATDAGDVPLLVDEGKTGFVVRRGDDDTLARRIVMLAKDRELCRRMGEAGRRKAEKAFGLRRLVDETMAAYRSAAMLASRLPFPTFMRAFSKRKPRSSA